MSVTKNMEEVLIKSGNNFKIRVDGTWETLGNIVSGEWTKQGNPVTGTWASGVKWKKRGSSESGLMVILGQVSKAILDRIDQLLDLEIGVYYYNGVDGNNNALELFAPGGTIIEDIKLTMKGDEHQTIALNISFNPQDSNVSCIPDDDLPPDAIATGASPVFGYNQFGMWLSTAAA